MKKLITLCMIIIAMQLNSQMIKTNHGWNYYSKSYFFKEWGEKPVYFSRVSKLSYNEDDNGLMIIYTDGQTETLYLTQVEPIFTSKTDAGHKYDVHEMLSYTTYTGLYLQIIFGEKVVIRLFYPNGFREYSY
jgi:hypothetical protein